MIMDAFIRAINIAGGQASLARQIEVSKEFVWQIARGFRPVPPGRCLQIEKATGVTCYELRPDVFRAPSEAA